MDNPFTSGMAAFYERQFGYLPELPFVCINGPQHGKRFRFGPGFNAANMPEIMFPTPARWPGPSSTAGLRKHVYRLDHLSDEHHAWVYVWDRTI